MSSQAELGPVGSSRARRRSLVAQVGAIIALVGVFGVAAMSTVAAQDTPTSPSTSVAEPGAEPGAEPSDPEAVPEADDEQLILGAEVFATSCASCHQAGGIGVPGQFPPLKGNPNVQDGEYVRETILGGRSGEIVVNGETYDGVMPAVSGLGDADLDAVIAYLQSGFATPAGGAPEVDLAANLADGSLTGPVNLITTLALLVGLAVGALVMMPRLAAAQDRLQTTWLDAWLKTGVIFVGVVALMLLIPNWIIKMGWFSELDGLVQDLLATGIWGIGFLIAMWSLWYAHRRDWI